MAELTFHERIAAVQAAVDRLGSVVTVMDDRDPDGQPIAADIRTLVTHVPVLLMEVAALREALRMCLEELHTHGHPRTPCAGCDSTANCGCPACAEARRALDDGTA